MGLLALLCPLGVLLALSLVPGKDRRRRFFYFIGFVFPVVSCVLSWDITPAIQAKALAVIQPTYRDLQVISELTELARDSSKPPEKRVVARMYLYRLWGILAVIRAADGQLVIYSPTEKDISAKQKTLDVRAEVIKDSTIIR